VSTPALGEAWPHLLAANIYLCFAALLHAGLEGIEKGYELPEPMEDLSDSNLSTALMSGADLMDAILARANLSGANLAETDLEEFSKVGVSDELKLTETTLEDLEKAGSLSSELVFDLTLDSLSATMNRVLAELKNEINDTIAAVKGLTQEQVEQAIGDQTTQLPDYLEHPKAWSARALEEAP